MVVATADVAFRVQPAYHPRVWGGQRLRGGPTPVGEAWVVHEASAIIDGPLAGRSLAEAAALAGPALLGARAFARTGARFPLLLKLLDTVDWLSVQVHPDDVQAAQLEGPGRRGKAEAWHIIDAPPDAQVIAGLRAGVSHHALVTAMRNGGVLDLLQREAVYAGDTLMIPPGAIHALGPGLLVYEVQQSSDITYRVFDWNRPQNEGRALHLEQSAVVARVDHRPRPIATHRRTSAGVMRLLTRSEFALDVVWPAQRPVQLATRHETFHALTAIRGVAELRGEGWRAPLPALQTALVPAASGPYTVSAQDPNCKVILCSIPDERDPLLPAR